MTENEKLILFRIDELAKGQKEIVTEQKKLLRCFNQLEVTFEGRMARLEERATVRGAIAGAISAILTAIAAGIAFLIKG